MTERKQYPAIDVVKFIMAILILMQHTCNEWAHSTGLVHAFFGLGNFAVPFFFTCSGFLFFSKYNGLISGEQKSYYKKWSLRIGKMYIVWTLIYFIFVVNSWFMDGFSWVKPLNWIHRAIVFSTYATIWFLPALWLGVTICCMLKKYFSFKASLIMIIILFGFGNLFGSYDNILIKIPVVESFYDWYMSVFITWRNGVFNGAPYVFIGILIAHIHLNKNNFRNNICLTVVFSLAFLVEAYCITRFKLGHATDMGFFLAPSIYFLMRSLVDVRMKNRQLWRHFRNLSMLIFLGQRLFLSALPGVWYSMTEWIENL